jgi:hypothetical protein
LNKVTLHAYLDIKEEVSAITDLPRSQIRK